MIEIDARGLRCPVPTLKLQRALRGAAPGTEARLVSDDPMVRIDLPHWAGNAGVTVLSIAEADGVTTALVRKD